MNIRLLFLSATFLCTSLAYAISYNEMTLPEKFIIYTDGNVAARYANPNSNFKKVILPTVNYASTNPGCYILCYSHDADNGVYSAGADIYVIGQIRVPGTYNGRNCVPLQTAHQDISKIMAFKTLCAKYFPSCDGNRCWAGPNTGGWFGITTSISN